MWNLYCNYKLEVCCEVEVIFEIKIGGWSCWMCSIINRLFSVCECSMRVSLEMCLTVIFICLIESRPYTDNQHYRHHIQLLSFIFSQWNNILWSMSCYMFLIFALFCTLPAVADASHMHLAWHGLEFPRRGKKKIHWIIKQRNR